MKIKVVDAKKLAIEVLKKYGYTNNESDKISDLMIWAQKRGSSQGLDKLFGWKSKKHEEAKEPVIEKDGDGFLLINAELNSHILACDLATKELVNRIGSKSIFVAGVKNAVNSAGALGYYTEQIAKSGYVGIMMSAADPGVVAFGGKSAVFGTNPISVSVPTNTDPILLDMSTAAMTWGDLVKYDNESKLLPVGFAFDEDGNPTVDPKKAMDGWVTTFDKSYKGSGLALVVQILAGPLVGSIYSKDINFCQYGSLIIAINPEGFGNRQAFLAGVENMIKEIKESPKADGFDEILMPGERGYRKANDSDENNELEISEQLYAKLRDF